MDIILDTIVRVYPRSYGQYKQNANIFAQGMKTSIPDPDCTTQTHVKIYHCSIIDTNPMVKFKTSIERDQEILESVMEYHSQ